MAELPIPAKIFLSDFPTLTYQVVRSEKTVGNLKGLTNDDEYGKYIAFLYGSDIKEGDVLISDERYVVRKVMVDTYLGNPDMLKAYY